MLYLIDANVIIDAKDLYYAMDQVPEFWPWIVHLGETDQIKIPEEIFDEIYAGSNNGDLFYQWRKDKNTINALRLDEDVDAVLLQKILDEGYGENLTDSELITIGADPFLVAAGLSGKDRMVVTGEVSATKKKRQNRKLPDVCDQFGVAHMNPFQFTRALGFSTSWKP